MRGSGEDIESMGGLFSSLLDRFTMLDELLEDQIAATDELNKSIQELPEEITVDAQIQQLVVQRSVVDSATYSFTPNDGVPDGDSVSVTRSMPFTGKVSEVLVGIPDGAEEELGVQVRDTEENPDNIFFPTNPETEVVVGNNIYHPFKVSHDVKQGDEIEARFFNESGNKRFPTLIATITQDADVEVLE